VIQIWSSPVEIGPLRRYGASFRGHPPRCHGGEPPSAPSQSLPVDPNPPDMDEWSIPPIPVGVYLELLPTFYRLEPEEGFSDTRMNGAEGRGAAGSGGERRKGEAECLVSDHGDSTFPRSVESLLVQFPPSNQTRILVLHGRLIYRINSHQ
jgi:hypothetical protein